MKKLKVTVLTKNEEYGKDLAKGLVTFGHNIEVELINEDRFRLLSKDDLFLFDLLLTDIKELKGKKTLYIGKEEKENVGNSNDEGISLSEYAGIGEIYDNLQLLKLKSIGVNADKRALNTKRIGFFSRKGGNGLTIAAINFARLLAGKADYNICYVNLTQVDDYDQYINANFKGIKSKDELLYRISSKSDIIILDYLSKDEFGVYYLKPDDDKNGLSDLGVRNQIIYAISREGYFDAIVIDCGKVKKLEEKEEVFDYIFMMDKDKEDSDNTFYFENPKIELLETEHIERANIKNTFFNSIGEQLCRNLSPYVEKCGL